MEQIELFSDPQKDAANFLKEAAAKIVKENELPLNKLFVRKNSGYYSVIFFDDVILQVGGKPKKYISIPTPILQRLNNYRHLAGNGKYTKFPIADFSEVANYESLAECAMQAVIDRI